MRDQLLSLKQEFKVIKEFNIYNINTHQFEVLESNECETLVSNLDEMDCLQDMSQMNLETDNQEYFIQRSDHKMAVLSLDKTKVYNKALLHIKVKSTLKKFA